MVWFSLGAYCLSKEMAEDVAEDLPEMGFRVRSPLEMANCVRARHPHKLIPWLCGPRNMASNEFFQPGANIVVACFNAAMSRGKAQCARI